MSTITFERNKKIEHRFWQPDDPEGAAEQTRRDLSLVGPALKRSDALIVDGSADFGGYFTFPLPPCIYRSGTDRQARWYTHCQIDPVKVGDVLTKPGATPGFTLREYARFENFYIGGACSNPKEDGGLIGWESTFELPAEVEFINCEVDASFGMDWGIYSWENVFRKVTMRGGVLRFCRLGVALAASGAGANQQILLDGVKLIGDANGSCSVDGATSEQRTQDGEGKSIANDRHAVLSPVLNRLGDTIMRDCESEVHGLVKQYSEYWGCPRIAALCTNRYDAAAGATSFRLERCRTKIIPGVAREWNDYDIRHNGKLAIVYDDAAVEKVKTDCASRVAAARGGSGEGGELKGWKAA